MRISSFACVLLMACGGANGEDIPSAQTDATPDATSDAGLDAEADAGPQCVSSIKLPTASDVTLTVHYTNGVTTSVKTHFCPSDVAQSCAFALKASYRTDDSGQYVYPQAEACHVQVPTSCLPCTKDVTVW
jgi:hypothetical protein